MKKLNYLLLLVSNCIIAQINYEKGYFIDNNGQKTDCLIKNEDWKNNPDKFYYKIDGNEQINEKNIQNIKEFGIDTFSKYERHEVLIDTSSTELTRLSQQKDPEWSKRTLFLKLIVEGDAKLYMYASGNGRRYFYSYKGSVVEQLIYKEYFNTKSQYAYQNKGFQQQLWNNLKCSETKKERIAKLDYKTNSLVKYFYEVNNCDGNKLITATDLTPKSSGFSNFKVKGGLNFSTLNLEYDNGKSIIPVEFENKIGAKVGVEFEHVFGFNRNKWSVFYEPTYQTYKSETAKVFSPYLSTKWSIDYKYLDHYFGFRYYMFLNNNAKIFLSTGVVYKQVLGEKILKFEGTKNPDPSGPDPVDEDYNLEIEPRVGLIVGLGFSHKKSNFELRYSEPDILQQYVNVKARFQTISVIYGFKIFDSKKK